MKLNDYELVVLANEGNEDATKLLYEKYRPIIIKKSKDAIISANHHGIEINDIIQEGYIAFDEAIKNFNQDEKTTFYTFAILCIDRKITNFIKKTTNRKSMLLNEAVSIDDVLDGVLSDSTNVENVIFDREDKKSKIRLLLNNLTSLEKQVFLMRIKGLDFEEIAKKLNKNTKAIYNAWARIKVKYMKEVNL